MKFLKFPIQKIFLLTDWSWLSDWMMPSDKHNSITTKAMTWFLHCSMLLRPEMCLFANCCSSNVCIMIIAKFTFALLCSWFLSPLLCRWQFAVAPFHGFVEHLIIVLIAEVFNTLYFCLKCSVECRTALKRNHNCPFVFSLWLIDPRGVRTVTSEFSIIFI